MNEELQAIYFLHHHLLDLQQCAAALPSEGLSEDMVSLQTHRGKKSQPVWYYCDGRMIKTSQLFVFRPLTHLPFLANTF